MYDDGASEAPLYLVPHNDGSKRLIRRRHPPPTTAPLPDDFDAITVTRSGTTIYDDAANSAFDIDYDDMTVAPMYEQQQQQQQYMPPPLPAPMSPPRHPVSPPRQRRSGSPSRSLVNPDPRSPQRRGAGLPSKARSVAGDRAPRGAAPSAPMPMPPMPPAKGPAAGRTDLVEKKVLEDGPERTISVWRENVANRSSEAGDLDTEGRSDVDSHAGRRRVSAESRRRVESLASASVKGKESRRGRESIDLGTEGPLSPLQRSFSNASTTQRPHPQPINTAVPMTPSKSQRRAPLSPSALGPRKTEYSASISDSTSQTRVALTVSLETVLGSCQPSLLHLLPVLEELGFRRPEHMTALIRMREETRDREVKEEALKKGITVVEWAIFIDKLQSL
ncbi:hypothetical protein BC834DRAFT_973612 [Gloeopeniophorella convolvens]|nr:hypothetical protein BC834DRAFT_973612 [Gloeopeniophorella convolvens]